MERILAALAALGLGLGLAAAEPKPEAAARQGQAADAEPLIAPVGPPVPAPMLLHAPVGPVVAPGEENPVAADANAPPRPAPPLWVKLKITPDRARAPQFLILESGQTLEFKGQAITTGYLLNAGMIQYRISGDEAGYPRLFTWEPDAVEADPLRPDLGLASVPLNFQEAEVLWPEPLALVLDPVNNRLRPQRGGKAGGDLPLAKELEVRFWVPEHGPAGTMTLEFSDRPSLRLVGTATRSAGLFRNTGELVYRLEGDRTRTRRYATWIADYFPPVQAGKQAPVLVLPIPLADFRPQLSRSELFAIDRPALLPANGF